MSGVLKNAAAMPVAEITRRAIVQGREDRKGTPAQANNFIKLMRGLCGSVGGRRKTYYIRPDPRCGDAKSQNFRVSPRGRRPTLSASRLVGPLERASELPLTCSSTPVCGAGTPFASAVSRRVGDRSLSEIKTEKTGAEVVAPLLLPLAQSLAAGPTGDLHFIVGERGQPLTKESFGNWFGEACRVAGQGSRPTNSARRGHQERRLLARRQRNSKRSLDGPMRRCPHSIHNPQTASDLHEMPCRSLNGTIRAHLSQP